jgi:hypothetical protein
MMNRSLAPRAWWKRTDPRNDISVPWQIDPLIGDEQEEAIVHALVALANENFRIATDRGWWHGRRVENDGDAAIKLLLAISEIVEAFEAIRRGRGWLDREVPLSPEESEKQGRTHRIVQGALSELGDACIRLLDVIGATGLALEFATTVRAKMAKNREHDGSDTGKRF